MEKVLLSRGLLSKAKLIKLQSIVLDEDLAENLGIWFCWINQCRRLLKVSVQMR